MPIHWRRQDCLCLIQFNVQDAIIGMSSKNWRVIPHIAFIPSCHYTNKPAFVTNLLTTPDNWDENGKLGIRQKENLSYSINSSPPPRLYTISFQPYTQAGEITDKSSI